MWSDWMVSCDCGFHSICCLMNMDKRLMEASWWRLPEGETGSCSDGRAMLRKSLIQFLIQFSVDGNVILQFCRSQNAKISAGLCSPWSLERRILPRLVPGSGVARNPWCPLTDSCYSVCICCPMRLFHMLVPSHKDARQVVLEPLSCNLASYSLSLHLQRPHWQIRGIRMSTSLAGDAVQSLRDRGQCMSRGASRTHGGKLCSGFFFFFYDVAIDVINRCKLVTIKCKLVTNEMDWMNFFLIILENGLFF